MAFIFPRVEYLNSPTGYDNVSVVNDNINNVISSYFGQDYAFKITYTRVSPGGLDATIEVYQPDYEMQILCLIGKVVASSYPANMSANPVPPTDFAKSKLNEGEDCDTSKTPHNGCPITPCEPDPKACPDTIIKNSNNTFVRSIPSNAPPYVLPNPNVFVNDVNEGTVISQQDIDISLIDGIAPVTPISVDINGNVITITTPPALDATIENSTGSFVQAVPSGDLYILPNVDIDVNGVVAGQPISQEPVSVNLSDGTNPITPGSVTLSGNTLDIELLDWVRPSDWLPMPTVVDTDDTFVGLYAVFPSGNNFAAFRFTTSAGQYRVDWGDGTIDLVNSNVAAEHTYDYSTYDPTNSTLTSRGYKQAMITVTAVSGLLRTCTFNLRRTTIPAQNQVYTTGFLDCILSMPNANSGNSIVFSGNLIRHSYVERFNVLTIGACTELDGMFAFCFSLQSVPLFDTDLVTDMLQMFNQCASIRKIPLFNTASVTRFQQMFAACSSLETVPLFNVVSGTNFNQMFFGCPALKEVPLFAFNPALTKNMGNMFNGCLSLKQIPLFDTTNTTLMTSMFQGCQSLQRIPLLNTADATSMSNMFNACLSLNFIPALSTASVNTSFAEWGVFGGSMSLDRCEVSFNEDILLRNCQLSQTELVNIFTNLAIVVGKTINITGNWGASALTLADRDIAILKGWTIVG